MDRALLSVPELVDSDCNAKFNKIDAVVIDNNAIQVMLIMGRRDPAIRFWLIPVVQQQKSYNNSTGSKYLSLTYHTQQIVHTTKRTIPKLIQFLHATSGSPPVKTWCKYAVTKIIHIHIMNMMIGIQLTGYPSV